MEIQRDMYEQILNWKKHSGGICKKKNIYDILPITKKKFSI